MNFSNKRGRPKKNKNKIDLGTDEFQNKKKSYIFDNLLNILKIRDIIDEVEYKNAFWFRYLYSVKFGNPNVITAYNISKVQGINTFIINKNKQERMEKIYNKISFNLQKNGLKNIVMNICIFDKLDEILQLSDKEYLEKLKEGLEIIGAGR